MSYLISTIVSLIMLTQFVGCSSTKSEMDKELKEEKHTHLKREYEVRNASSDTRPSWIEDAELWARQYGKDVAVSRYFSFETTPKVDREIACSLAKTNAKADIAGEISSFIEKTLGSSKEGQASIDENNPITAPMREFVESTLAQKTMAMIHGAAIVKSYWEKRKYLEERGAKRDYIGFTCGILIRMDSKELKKAVRKAADFVVRAADDPQTKANVKKALNNISDNFAKSRQGLI